MRIISGSLKGRQFNTPKGHRTHPMSDKIRGGLFNVLGDISGLTVLDAFAGSGALSFEAVSRGASSAMAIENDKRAHLTIVSNIENLELADKVIAVKAFTNSWSNRHHNQKFDLIIADPPYDDPPYRDLKILPRHLNDGGTIILSWPGKADIYYFPGYSKILVKNYGDAQLVFYRKSA